jgi:transcription elongation factor Elf1
MSVACPQCGSRFVRESRERAGEKMPRFMSPLRCQHCRTRFIARTFVPSDLKWARCPRCERMDLSSWTGKTYAPRFLMGLKITFGAHRWRCEYCRVNFASFRPRKEIFTFSRWQKIQAAKSPADPLETRKSGEPDTAA